MINRVVLLGRMVRNPELKKTSNDISTTTFTLAVNRGYTKGGQIETDFIDCVAWRNTAEFVCRNFTKGQMCGVEGRLQIRDWTDKNGYKRRSAEVVVDNVSFGGDKKQNAAADEMAGFEELNDYDEAELPF